MSRLFCAALSLSLFAGCASGPTVAADPGGDTRLTWAGGRIHCVEGSTCDPVRIDVPHRGFGNVFDGVNAVLAYDCDSRWWVGNEQVFAFDVQAPGRLEALLDGEADLAAFVVAVDEQYTCLAGGEQALEVDLNPGRHWLVVDSTEKVEWGDFELDLQLTDALGADDAYEPNDTVAQASWIPVEQDGRIAYESVLTAASPVDYYTFELDALGSFELVIEGDGIDVDLETWDGARARYDEQLGRTHVVSMTNPYGADDDLWATVTVKVRMTDEGWDQGGARYTVEAVNTAL